MWSNTFLGDLNKLFLIITNLEQFNAQLAIQQQILYLSILSLLCVLLAFFLHVINSLFDVIMLPDTIDKVFCNQRS